MITCKSFRTFYEPDDARWSSGENLFVLINNYNFQKKTKLFILLVILKLYARIDIFILKSNFNFINH